MHQCAAQALPAAVVIQDELARVGLTVADILAVDRDGTRDLPVLARRLGQPLTNHGRSQC